MNGNATQQLMLHNQELREEVRTAREAAEITARLVVEQFEETERILDLFKSANAQREAVLDAASRISIIAADRQGKITLFNRGAERMLGYSAKEVLGKRTPLDFHLADEMKARCGELEGITGGPAEGIDLFLHYARHQVSEEHEWTYVRKDGTSVPVSMSVTGIYTSEKELTGFLCAAMDITQRKRQEESLREAMRAAESANRTKSTFLANMSHELRTPLNAIIGYSELLEEEAEDLELESFVVDLRKIRTAGKHLLALINDVLDLSKIEAGKADLFIERFPIEGMIRDVIATISPLIEKKANRLDLRIAGGLGDLTADLTRTRQVLFNLLSNAAKFTEKGTITLEAFLESSPAGEMIVFKVRDTGIGMTGDQLSRIFEPFVQADASTTKQFGGTGLGLTISRTFCRMMGGEMTVESEHGKGSTFTVKLPREVKAKQEAAESALKQEGAKVGEKAAGKHGPNTVLVIDDDPAVHDMLATYLRKDGFDVVCAISGEEGLRLAKEVKPMAITLDIIMPGMDGWAVLGALKANPETASIPVVLITIEEKRDLGFTLGASDYLVKPISHVQLFDTLRKYKHGRVAGRVLVVEDEKTTRDLMVRLVRKEGWDVVEAGNGREALDRIAERKPDLIFLDLMMPVMDGFEFIRELRANKEYYSIPVVVVTAKDLTPEERQWLNGDVYRVFRKGSFSRDELLQQIREIILCEVKPAK